MLLRNVSGRPLIWDGQILLPDREAELPEEIAHTPGVRAFVDQGYAVLILEPEGRKKARTAGKET